MSGRFPHHLHGGIKVFAGQRAEGFYVDLGAIFDLGDLRPFENLHAQYGMHLFSKGAPGVNATAQLNVHSIAIQVPIGDLLWGSPHGKVSRLANPLVNEVLIPLGAKDFWNSQPPHADKLFLNTVTHPELAGLLPALYPGVFPNLAKLVAAKTPRADLEAILMSYTVSNAAWSPRPTRVSNSARSGPGGLTGSGACLDSMGKG